MGMGMGMFEPASQARSGQVKSSVIASGQVRSRSGDLPVQTTAVQSSPPVQ